jgi:hypothetical protein
MLEDQELSMFLRNVKEKEGSGSHKAWGEVAAFTTSLWCSISKSLLNS